MAKDGTEQEKLERLIFETISLTLNKYAGENPNTNLQVGDVRTVLLKVIDYLDIAEITDFGPWQPE